jgi:hypothetical protein
MRAHSPSVGLYGDTARGEDMEPMAGPHHSHPNGDIDLIMPVEPGAEFDGRGAGWLVYGAGSALTGDVPWCCICCLAQSSLPVAEER